MGSERCCVVRGGGDLATGVVWRLWRAGIQVVVTELAEPLTIRRTVAVSTAVADGDVTVEGMHARRVTTRDDILLAHQQGSIPVVVAPSLVDLDGLVAFDAVVDARLAKSALDTSLDDAPLVIGLGPGFTASVNCHAVIETQRGHRLGRVMWSGSAAPNTGTPGVIEGRGRERVIRAQCEGTVHWVCAIGDTVIDGASIGSLDDVNGSTPVVAPFTGVLRGAIAEGTRATAGLKIADVDPRIDDTSWRQISDKALAIGGGVLEAVLAGGPP